MTARALLFLCLFFTGAAQAADEGLSAFYSGKNLRLTVGSSAGGGTDIVARLLARHMGRYMPGKPGMIVVNQPGGGG